ncbi:T9SS type A sorting domain-containing protein [bacterium]|nr:T9SS type A sorting domain-containing protein [bacterium]
MRTLCMILLVVAAGTAIADEMVSLRPFETPDPLAGWPNAAFSADGSRMACYLDQTIYVYEDGVFTGIGAGDPLNSQIWISADGTVVVSSSAGPNGVITPTIWREADGWAPTHLGSLPDAPPCDNSYGTGYACNEDGSVVVGLAWDDGCQAVAFAWTAETGMVDIGGVRASTISPSGTTIAGFTDNAGGGGRLPVYWTLEADGTYSEPIPIGGDEGWGECWGTSYHGDIVVGEFTDWTVPSQAFLYTEAEGIRWLGTAEDDETHSSMANFITNDGKVIGRSGTSGPWGMMYASIWRDGQGMQYLEDYIVANATELPDGFEDGFLRWTIGISADGSIALVQWMDDFWNTQYYLVEFESSVSIEGEDPIDDIVSPASLQLAQNYPNPFNPMTTIEFALPSTQSVQLAIYDLAGRQVRTLVSGETAAGEHAVVWDGRDTRGNAVPSGTYLYRLQTDSQIRLRTLTLLK